MGGRGGVQDVHVGPRAGAQHADVVAPQRPRSLSFLRDEEMPRNATGKILHRVLKTKLTS